MIINQTSTAFFQTKMNFSNVLLVFDFITTFVLTQEYGKIKNKYKRNVSEATMSPKTIVPMLVEELQNKSLSNTKLELAIHVDGYYARISVEITKMYTKPSETQFNGERIIII